MAKLSRVFSIAAFRPLDASTDICVPAESCPVMSAIFLLDSIMSPIRAAMVSISATRSFKNPRF
ncbi:Uncharacterised protein [Mycobacteroides abscessus subsp. abscessus]|nr:Uncharacterised protein [Mycobacteroides abscessus subsp. abscessus]